ncbi:MAG: T9SS type A sorting domain-containing protein [Bacteroidota bacterium]|nr:T9SS type A sorting domain-containing protein [Bacteroidota bacterium]
MKKRLLLAVLVGAAGVSAMAQSPVQLDPNRQGTDPSTYSAPAGTQVQGKRVVTDWYNFIDAADANNGGAISFTVYSNNSLFPDSTVLQRYGDGNGGTILGSVTRHNIGQMFDPSSFYYTDLLSEHNPYEVDSIAFAYRYSHVVPGSVDTIEFQVFYDDGVRVGNLIDGNGNVIEPTAWIIYDRSTEKGGNAKQEWRMTLDETDTAWAQFKTVGQKLPNVASIGRDGLFAVAYRFLPGYAYNVGDTLDQTWDDPEVTNKINQFQPLIGTDNSKTEEDSYNHGLSVRSFNKYDETTGWADEFVPGDAWNNFTEYVYISVHLSSPNVSVPAIEEASAQVYPNPSMGSELVNIAFTTNENTNVTIELFDLLGNKVQTVMNGNVEAGQQVANVNAADLSAGVYVYSIKAGEQTITGKLSIVK